MPVDSGGKRLGSTAHGNILSIRIAMALISISLVCQHCRCSQQPGASSKNQTKSPMFMPLVNETLIFESSIDRIYYNPSAMVEMQQQLGQPTRQVHPNGKFIPSPNDIIVRNRQQAPIRLIYQQPDQTDSAFYSLSNEVEAPRLAYQPPRNIVNQEPFGSTFAYNNDVIKHLGNSDVLRQTGFPHGLSPSPFDSSSNQPNLLRPSAQELLNARTRLIQASGLWQNPAHANQLVPSGASQHQFAKPASWSNQQLTSGVLPFERSRPLKHTAAQPLDQPKVALNLTSLLKPGQVLLSQQVNRSTRPNVSVTNMNDFRGLIEALRPLALSSDDKATNVRNSLNLSPDAIKELEVDDQPFDEQHQEELEDEAEMTHDGENDLALKQLRSQNKLDRILPTSHMFGGSVGLVSDNKAPKATIRRSKGRSSKESGAEEAQQAAFLKTLAALGAKLSDDQDADDDSDADEHPSSASSTDEFYRRAANPAGAIPGPTAIPIELLVDHLMSGSRQAARANEHPQHPDTAHESSTPGGELIDNGLGQDYDDDDDEHEDFEADGNALPVPEDPRPGHSMEGSESMRRETELKPNEASSVQINFNSVANKSDSWIPLTNIGTALGTFATTHRRPAIRKSREYLSEERSTAESSRDTNRSKRRRRRKRRRPNSDLKWVQGESGLIIGNKKLSRAELIRLIGILNKMASSKKSSKEREASRKLLRFLIKIAIENYKQKRLNSHSSASRKAAKEEAIEEEQNQDTRLRDSLRSLLVEPELGASIGHENTSRISIQLQPWRVPSTVNRGESNEADNTTGSETERPKSLSQISEDLERYFDSDFFEDLADKNVTDTLEQPVSGKKESNETSKVGDQSVPVPTVYERKRLEEADEDDVDLDHVRVVTRKVTPVHDKPPTRRVGTRSFKRKHRRKAHGRAQSLGAEPRPSYNGKRKHAANSHKKVTPNEDDDDDGEAPKPTGSKVERKSAKIRKRRKRRRLKKDGAKRSRPHKEDERQDEGEDVDEDDVQSADRSNSKADEEKGHTKSERGMQANPKRQRGSRRRRKLTSREPDRNDIPAPILASKVSKASSEPGESDRKSPTNRKSSPSKELELSAKKRNTSKSTALKTKGKKNQNEVDNKSKSKAPTKKLDQKSATLNVTSKVLSNKAGTHGRSPRAYPIPRVEGDEENYANEGAQYCEDGECRSVLRSSHPGFNEYLEDSQGKGSLVKQIDRWLTDE